MFGSAFQPSLSIRTSCFVPTDNEGGKAFVSLFGSFAFMLKFSCNITIPACNQANKGFYFVRTDKPCVFCFFFVFYFSHFCAI